MAVVLLDASVVSSILSINQADPSQPFTVERYQKLIENRPSPKRRDARDPVGARLPREDPWGETIVASEEVTGDGAVAPLGLGTKVRAWPADMTGFTA